MRGVLSVLERRLGGQEGGRYFFGNRYVFLPWLSLSALEAWRATV